MKTRPADPVALKFDHFGPDLADDPYPTYKYLRQNCPVGWSENYDGFWVLTRHDDIDEVIHKPDVFSSYPNAIPDSLSELGQATRLIPIEIDPPEHTAYRKILDPYFGPKIMKVFEADARQLAASLIDDMVKAPEEVDFIASFAQVYPTMLFCELVGFPESQRPELVEQVDQMLKVSRVAIADPEGYKAAAADIGVSMAGSLWGLMENSKAAPKDDLLGLFTTAKKGDVPLDDIEVLGILFTLQAAGLETVKSTLGNAFAYFGAHTELRDRMVADPEIIPSAVEEMLRFESPINPGRTALNDYELNGYHIAEGEHVLLITGSAGRDESKFINPDEVDFSRTPNNHLAFGVGRHRCLGSHLARMELRVAFEEIHRRIPSYTVPEGATIEKHVGFSRGVDRLPFAVGQPAYA